MYEQERVLVEIQNFLKTLSPTASLRMSLLNHADATPASKLLLTTAENCQNFCPAWGAETHRCTTSSDPD
jgi:hypothetical protein